MGAVPWAWTPGFPIIEQVTKQAVQPACHRGELRCHEERRSRAWALLA